MIPNQRHLFDLPDDVAYLNIAYTAPLLHAAANAGRDAIQAKQNPWTISSNDFFSSVETVRDLFAGIVGGEEFRSMPLFKRSSRRLSWLSINIVLNIIAASVIALYQEKINEQIDEILRIKPAA